MLEIDSVAKRFVGRPPVWAVRDVSARIAPGEIVGLVGPNGAGKTTTLAIAAGLIAQTAGTVRFGGAACPPREPRPWLGCWIGEPGFYGHLRGVTHLRVTMSLKGVNLDSRSLYQLLERVGLHATDADRRVRDYSTGMRRRLAYASAAGMESPVLMLDEPTAGLDPIGIRAILDDLVTRAERGTAVLLSSHRLAEVESVCDRIYLISQGAARELTPGSWGAVLRIRCSDPAVAQQLLSTRHAFRVGRNVVLSAQGNPVRTVLDELERRGIEVEAIETAPATLEEAFFIESEEPW
jgi:ABC-2 type transport system ATP-binding protein